MPMWEQTVARLRQIAGLTVLLDEPLAGHTRFGIGGPADVYAEAAGPAAFVAAVEAVRGDGVPHEIIGSGTNLIVSDAGYRGIILRLADASVDWDGLRVRVSAGATLWDFIDEAIARGLGGMETMAGIPGSAGAAVYGNAGAYGHSISERVAGVRFYDGAAVREIGNAECEFEYRGSVFKRKKDWLILDSTLELEPADAKLLRQTADEIVKVRNEKFPPTMKCAGSIFKNFLLAGLPEAAAQAVPSRVIREGKVPAAYFLEQVGAKGMVRGGIRVADYHANLIYNAGGGTARELTEVIAELKARVAERFGIGVDEEVQYVGGGEPAGPGQTGSVH